MKVTKITEILQRVLNTKFTFVPLTLETTVRRF